MGMMTAHIIQMTMKSKTEGDGVLLLDEFPNLGRLPGIKQSVAQLREKGVRTWMMVQDSAQVEDVYGKANATSLKNQAEVIQLLGCRSVEMASYVEKRAGTRTQKTASYNLPDGLTFGEMPKQTLKEEKIPIIPAADALGMQKGTQILIRHGYPVLWANVRLWTGPFNDAANTSPAPKEEESAHAPQ
jgi:type IV secretion system protein VirD4